MFFLRNKWIEKKEASISFSRKAIGYRINMQLIEGQVCVFFNKQKTDRYNRIRIESVRVRGSNQDYNSFFRS